MGDQELGVILTEGPEDWQILQQDGAGSAQVAVGGRWVHEIPGRVEVRLVWEATGVPVTAALDWQPATTREHEPPAGGAGPAQPAAPLSAQPGGTPTAGAWSAVLRDVPAGGLYRLETRFHADNNPAGEWSTRGDMRHFLGVGDLWVIAGQSNAAGYGRGPVEDSPELGLHMLRSSGHWALAAHPLNESTDTQHPVNREAANSSHSPYLHFARLLKRALGCPIGLVPTALGGLAIASLEPHRARRGRALSQHGAHRAMCRGPGARHPVVPGRVGRHRGSSGDLSAALWRRRSGLAGCAGRPAVAHPHSAVESLLHAAHRRPGACLAHAPRGTAAGAGRTTPRSQRE